MTETKTQRDSLLRRAVRKLRADRTGMGALLVVAVYLAIALGVRFLGFGTGWDELVTDAWAPMSPEHWFGTNRNGQDILKRTIYSTKTAFEVGIIVSLMSTLIGGLLGCVAGFFSGTWVDELVIWLYGCLDSIPFFLFTAAVAFALQGSPYAMHIAMVGTFWTTTARLIRGEVIRLKYFEYVEAARALGVPRYRILLRHILPNTSHILLVQSTIVFVTAIKNEVILSFLGLGVKDGISWGLMIAEAASEVTAGEFNNLFFSSLFMFVLVMAFNLLSDSLQDALDPRKVGA